MDSKIISVVTGASGFVGSHLVDRLLQMGHHVKCILRKSSSKRWLEGKPVEIVDCGLFNKESLKDVLKDADYLFHVAGVVKAKTNEEYIDGNVESTRVLLEVLLEVNPDIKRVLIVSSQTACGPSKNGIPCTEESKENPITRYGKSKFTQEQVARSYMDRLPISIIRAVAVFGPRDTEIYLVFKAYKKGFMGLIGFDKKLVNLVHVYDLINGIILAAENEKAIGQTYFIGSQEYYDWVQIRNVISKAMGKKALIVRVPHTLVFTVAAVAEILALFSSKAATFNIEKARDFVQKYWICDVSKAVNELGFRQAISLEDGIKQTVDWYREVKWL
jgi:nucleoside-diphosphate-sugar epimerase